MKDAPRGISQQPNETLESHLNGNRLLALRFFFASIWIYVSESLCIIGKTVCVRNGVVTVDMRKYLFCWGVRYKIQIGVHYNTELQRVLT